MTILELFRSGMDTLQISEHLGGAVAGWPESCVYRVMNAERREERTPVLWADVCPKPTPKPKVRQEPVRKLIPYVGSEDRA